MVARGDRWYRSGSFEAHDGSSNGKCRRVWSSETDDLLAQTCSYTATTTIETEHINIHTSWVLGACAQLPESKCVLSAVVIQSVLLVCFSQLKCADRWSFVAKVALFSDLMWQYLTCTKKI